jgi:monoterpene epsilon-lactone hydrolase
MSSIQAQLVSFLLVKHYLRNMCDPFKHDINVIRNKSERTSNRIKLPKGSRIENVTIRDFHAEWLYASSVKDSVDRVILYFHSGGFCMNYSNNHRDFALGISKATNTKILVIDYRLAPENKYPAANEDCVNAYLWLLSQGYDPKKIIIGGDSCGAGLALMTLLSLRNSGVALPRASFFLSLMGGDLKDYDGESYYTRKVADPLNTIEIIKKYGELYLGSTVIDPPIKQNLQGLPEMLIQVGDNEILLSDSIRLAKKAEQDGVKVALEVYDGMWHVFQAFSLIVPEARKGTSMISDFANRCLAG